jgi:hypothetical protein
MLLRSTWIILVLISTTLLAGQTELLKYTRNQAKCGQANGKLVFSLTATQREKRQVPYAAGETVKLMYVVGLYTS